MRVNQISTSTMCEHEPVVERMNQVRISFEKQAAWVLSTFRNRLITKEDPLHVHKTLGVVALFSFIFRLSNLGEGDMGFRTYPNLTIPTILLHFLLTASSFEFRLPKKRIIEGSRIWPQARLHSLIFLCRGLALIGIYCYEDYFQQSPSYTANLVVVLVTMALADLATFSAKDYKSNTIRDLSAPALMKYYFSVMQFYATAASLYGIRRSTGHFYVIIVLQLSAFGATLRRKNILSHRFAVIAYGVALFSSFIVVVSELRYTYHARGALFLVGNCAAMLRLGPWPRSKRLSTVTRNKYLIWSLMAVLCHKIRYVLANESHWLKPHHIPITVLMSFIPIIAHGYYQWKAEKKQL